jgi:hypothetical protein
VACMWKWIFSISVWGVQFFSCHQLIVHGWLIVSCRGFPHFLLSVS